jgi:probable F420-dependent oxidoreductase
VAREIRVAAHVLPQHGEYARQRVAWIQAEELGAEAVFTTDHFFPASTNPRGKNLECWTLLAALAEVTERVEIGPLVTAAAFRNPNLVADMARTIDHISGGRFVLGIGAGWFRLDYREYGYEYGTAASRVRELAASLPVIEERLGKLNPPPVRSIPILIGGAGERVTLRLVAQHADIWHCLSGDPETIRRKNAVLDDWCMKVGRDPGEIERACGGLATLDLDALADAGVTFFTISLEGPEYDVGPLREAIAWRNARQK